jgi:hypothetical protein
LRPNYPDEPAKEIARELVNSYPEHGFVINRDEVKRLLNRTFDEADSDTKPALDRLEGILTSTPLTAIGRVEKKEAPDGNG